MLCSHRVVGFLSHHVSVFVEVEVKVHGEKLCRVSLKCFEATKIRRDSVSYLGRDECE